jgi:hypothetical protein
VLISRFVTVEISSSRANLQRTAPIAQDLRWPNSYPTSQWFAVVLTVDWQHNDSHRRSGSRKPSEDMGVTSAAGVDPTPTGPEQEPRHSSAPRHIPSLANLSRNHFQVIGCIFRQCSRSSDWRTDRGAAARACNAHVRPPPFSQNSQQW